LIYPHDDRNFFERFIGKDAEKYVPYYQDRETGEKRPVQYIEGIVGDATPGGGSSKLIEKAFTSRIMQRIIHVLERNHFPGKSASQIESMMTKVMEKGEKIIAPNGNKLYRYDKTVVIDDLLSEGSAGTMFNPKNIKKFIQDWLYQNR
jgi:hypothetical protein